MRMAEGRYVITMDKRRRIISDGCVVYDGDKIVDVGKTDVMKEKYRNIEEKFGGRHSVVLPGLINTHMHLELSFFRGLWDGISLSRLKRNIAEVVPHMTVEDIYTGSMLSLVDLVKNGVTTTIHISLHADKAAEAMSQLGTRGVVCTAMQDREIGEREAPPRSTDEVLKENIDLIEKWNGAAQGRIKAWFGPYTELLTTPELLRRTDELADKYQTGIHAHLAETYESQMFIQGICGKRVYEYVHDTGMLGPNVLAAHSCWLSENEIELIKKTGTNIAYCPCVESMISDGIAPTVRLLSEGVNVSLAIDANCNNQTSDLFREARFASLLHKNLPPLVSEVIPAEQALELITVNPAKALLWEKEIGSLEAGKKADLILVDIKKPYFMPVLDKPRATVVSNLIYAGSGNDVNTVIIDGKTIVKNKVIQTLNENEIIEKFQRATEDLMERSHYTIERDLRWPVE